jgi:hypothetical protein
VRDVRVAHSRQFTGGIFTRMSMVVRAVSDDFGALVGQELRRQLPDLVRRHVQRSRNMSLAITLRRERLNHCDGILAIESSPEILGGNRSLHRGPPMLEILYRPVDPANSLLLKQYYLIWTELEGFGAEFEKFPLNFPVIRLGASRTR